MILLGSVQRTELIRLLEDHVGRKRRQQMSPSGKVAAEIVNEKSGNGRKFGEFLTIPLAIVIFGSRYCIIVL